MIAILAEIYPASDGSVLEAAAAGVAATMMFRVATKSAALARGALPAMLGIAEPIEKGAVVRVWLKHIVGVLLCGALIALGNWIYTLFSAQWAQAGFPDLPPMVAKPGGGQAVPMGGAAGGGPKNAPPRRRRASGAAELSRRIPGLRSFAAAGLQTAAAFFFWS